MPATMRQMIYQLQRNGISVSCEIATNERVRRLGLSVHPDGRVQVRMPSMLAPARAVQFIEQSAPWIFQKMALLKKRKAGCVVLPPSTLAQYKLMAQELVAARVEYFNRFYRFTINRITVRDQKTRWGSCSKSKNLNFNYRLALIDPSLADYVVVHELCHLAELNHSKEFWNLVAKVLPNYKELRHELKRIRLT